jgi:hypothetical protein
MLSEVVSTVAVGLFFAHKKIKYETVWVVNIRNSAKLHTLLYLWYASTATVVFLCVVVRSFLLVQSVRNALIDLIGLICFVYFA